MIGNSIEQMNGVKKLDGNMIVMKDGRTLKDLENKLNCYVIYNF